MNVADYLSRALDRSEKSQKQVAYEAGFSKPNIITMFKQGKTRVPLHRVPALAKSLAVDSKSLMSMCLSEYHPELKKVLREVYDVHFDAHDMLGDS